MSAAISLLLDWASSHWNISDPAYMTHMQIWKLTLAFIGSHSDFVGTKPSPSVLNLTFWALTCSHLQPQKNLTRAPGFFPLSSQSPRLPFCANTYGRPPPQASLPSVFWAHRPPARPNFPGHEMKEGQQQWVEGTCATLNFPHRLLHDLSCPWPRWKKTYMSSVALCQRRKSLGPCPCMISRTETAGHTDSFTPVCLEPFKTVKWARNMFFWW